MEQPFAYIHPYLTTIIVLFSLGLYGYILIKFLQFLKWIAEIMICNKRSD